MSGRIGLVYTVAAIALASSGCITPGYDGAKLARNAGPTCELPIAQRNLVYVFVVGGNNPMEMMALDEFRRGLNTNGFAKIATGPSIYSGWMASEMKKIHEREPDAVFAIAGLESAAMDAVKLSEKASEDGIPIRGVVVVDAAAKTPRPRYGLRTLMVSGSYSIRAIPEVETLVLPAPGQLGLSAESKTVDRVVQLLNELTIEVPVPSNATDDSLATYPLAPDVQIIREAKFDPEWDFMFDRPGGVTRAIDVPLPPRSLSAPGSNTAGK